MQDAAGDSLNKNIGATVAGALILVGILHGSSDAAISALQAGKLEAGTAEYIAFGKIYASTLILSVTITLAVAAVVLPPLFDTQPHWFWPVAILVLGAGLTGLPVRPAAAGPVGLAFGALNTFAAYYGAAFVGGLVVGVAGGIIIYLVADHLG